MATKSERRAQIEEARNTLKALDGVTEEELRLTVHYPGYDPMLSGDITLEREFHHVRDHCESHAIEIAS